MRIKITCVFLFAAQIIFAQTWKWNPTEKIEDNFNLHFCGQSGKNAFVLFSKFSIKKDFKVSANNNPIMWERKNVLTLVKYNTSSYTPASQTPFEFKKELSVFYDGFISENNLYFLYTSIEKGKIVFYADKYDVNGQFNETISMYEPPVTLGSMNIAINDDRLPSYYTFTASDNKNFICLNAVDGSIMLFDKSMKKLWQNKFEYKYLTDVIAQDDGTVYALGGTDSQQDLIKYDNTGKSSIQKINYSEQAVQDFNLRADEKNKLVYVLAVYGVSDKKFKMYWGPKRSSYFMSNGLLVNAYDMASLTEKNKVKIPFSDEILLAVSGKSKIEKVKGLESIVFDNLFFTNDGGVIAIMQKQFTVQKDITGANGRLMRTEYRACYADIILIKTDKNGATVQKRIERATQGDSKYDYMFTSASFFINDKLYIMYNEGTSSYTLKSLVFSANLDDVSQKEIKTYQEHKVYLSLRNSASVGDKKIIVWGKEAKNVSSAILKFD